MRHRIITEAHRIASPILSRVPLNARTRAKKLVDPTIALGVLRSIRHRRANRSGALVTIVVPVYNVQRYLSAFLASVVSQTHHNLEILVVNDGSPDRSPEIARAWGIIDPRIRVIDQENGGLGDARNTGVREARGQFITFADSDDELHRDAIRTMLATLEQTGSDFVVGNMVRQKDGRRWLPHWTKSAHREDRYGITLRDHPEIMLDVFACNKLWDIDFFRDNVGGFPTRIAYEDQEPSIKSYLSARAFDVITDSVYYWRIRDDGSSISQQKAKLTDLKDRLTVTKAVAERIRASGDQAIQEEWFRKLLAFDFVQYAEQVPRTDAEYFAVLSDGLRDIIEPFDDALWASVPLYPRLAGYFAMLGDEENLLTVLAGKVYRGTGYLLTRYEGEVFARPGYADDFTVPVPDALFRIDPDDLKLVTRAERVHWIDDTVLDVTVSAFCQSAFADDVESEPRVQLSLVNRRTGAARVLSGTTVEDPTRNELAGSEWRDATVFGVRTRIDTSDLLADDDGATDDDGQADQSWRFIATVDVGGIPVSSVISTKPRDGGAGTLGFSSVTPTGRWVITHDGLEGITLRRAAPQAESLVELIDGRRLFCRIRSVNGKRIVRLHVSNRRTWQSYAVKPTGYDRHGHVEFDVELAPLPKQHRRPSRQTWALKIEFEDGTKGQIAASHSTAQFDAFNSNAAPVMLDANGFGYLRVIEHPFLFTCDEIIVNPGTQSFTFAGSMWTDGDADRNAVTLAASGRVLHPTQFRFDSATDRYAAVFRLTATDWAGNVTGLPNGGYTLRWSVASGPEAAVREQWATLSDAFTNDLPRYYATDQNRIRMTRTAWGRTMWLRISPAMRDDELGLRNRRRTIDEAIASTATSLDESIVFESYHGKQISDSVRSLFERIRSEHPTVRTYWSVNSPAVSVPAGSTRIIQGTSDWMSAVHRSRYLVNNSNFPGYTRLRDNQRYLQTWHGTPMKKIAEDMPPENLSLGYRVLMRREVNHWEALLAQNPFSVDVLPQAFRFDGLTWGLGYPRNDILLSADRDNQRAAVRSALGISPDAPVVLYAPTFRDSQKTAGGYAFATELDFSKFQAALPPGAVTLVRGHANTVPSDVAAGTDLVIDVSSYGEISELFLAADVLVTDYSSLLFDFAVTRKPMIFFVPDLDEYESSTRGFYLQFSEICPGPMVRTTEDAASRVSDAFTAPDRYIDEKYTAFVERFAPWDDGQATGRVLDALVDQGWFQDARQGGAGS